MDQSGHVCYNVQYENQTLLLNIKRVFLFKAVPGIVEQQFVVKMLIMNSINTSLTCHPLLSFLIPSLGLSCALHFNPVYLPPQHVQRPGNELVM